ncbi:MAG: hypothetical protein ACREBR_00725 [bacterium]
MANHNTVNCFKKPKTRGKRSASKSDDAQKRKRSNNDDEHIHAIISKTVKAAMKASFKTNSDDELNNLNEVDMYLPSQTKKRKTVVYVPQTLGTITSQSANPTTLKVLIDGGCTSPIIREQFTKQFLKTVDSKTWKTQNGTFKTKHKAIIKFKLPEFCRMKEITWSCYINNHTTTQQTDYDMIIGLDLQQELGIVVDNEKCEMRWGDHNAPMKEKGSLSDRISMQQLLYEIENEPSVIMNVSG